MTVHEMRQKLRDNNIDMFAFCMENCINPRAITKAEQSRKVSQKIKMALDNYIYNSEAKYGQALDEARTKGLAKKETIEVNLSNSDLVSLKVDLVAFGKIKFEH